MRSNVLASFVVTAGLPMSLIYGCAHFKQSLGDGDVVLAQSAPSSAPVNVCEGASRIPDGWVVTDESHTARANIPVQKQLRADVPDRVRCQRKGEPHPYDGLRGCRCASRICRYGLQQSAK